MASIDRFMAWLEKRLQELVEGGASWLLPGGHRRRELAGWLAEVMNDSIRCCRDGSLQAPDLFILTLPPAAAARLDDQLLSELAVALQSEARRRGLVFFSEPVVQVIADPHESLAKIKVSFSEREDGDTITIKVDPQASAPAERSLIGQAYLVVAGQHTFLLDSPVVSIGRETDNMLVLEDMRVSRKHAQLRLIEGQYVIFDLQSTGGTTVNGRPVTKQGLASGDVISLAGVPLVYGHEVLIDRDVTQKLPVDSDRMEKL